MSPAPLPLNEAERLAALQSYRVLDTGSEAAFDDLVALAARLTQSPIAMVSLVDAGRQWNKARVGADIAELPREDSFCAHTILAPGQPLVVPDATRDERFRDNPFVTGPAALRAYLGVPLVNPEGHALGSLCVFDNKSRTFETSEVGTLQTLARAVTANLELRRALRHTREAALTDPLTGLPNRRATMTALAESLAAGGAVAVIAIDLDHFKEANDSEGHAAGDALLQAAAQRLREAVRPSDMVGRIGGDEFVLLLPEPGGHAAVCEIASRASAALHRPVPFGSRLLRLGATLGVALAPEDVPADAAPEERAGIVLRIADEALIRAKQGGRGSIGHARREDAAQLLRIALMLRAFDAGAPVAGTGQPVPGASVQLQPIVTLGTPHALVALEALARWTHPEVGAVPPGEMLAVIGPERTARFGHAVRDLALAAFATLRAGPAAAALAGTRLALNLSAAEVSRAGIALQLVTQVERAGLSLRDIEIEITEEVLLERVSDSTLDQLAALRGRGARLVLDDFGTGNSGLSQLLRLPLDGVKLDKRFVQRLGLDARAAEIVRATVSLAGGLGLAVVAEGVEDERQATMLQALGCDVVQGFLYAEPMAPEALPDWLSQGAARNVHRLRQVVPGG